MPKRRKPQMLNPKTETPPPPEKRTGLCPTAPRPWQRLPAAGRSQGRQKQRSRTVWDFMLTALRLRDAMRVLSRIYGASVQCTSVSSSYRVASLWHSSSRPLACSGSCAIQLWEAQHKKLEQQEQANPANGITIPVRIQPPASQLRNRTISKMMRGVAGVQVALLDHRRNVAGQLPCTEVLNTKHPRRFDSSGCGGCKTNHYD